MALSFGLLRADWPILDTIKPGIITAVGVAAIIVGVVIALSDKSIKRGKQVHEEVPIYEGTGKNRKIVGYQRK
jgi:hypothetical protein